MGSPVCSRCIDVPVTVLKCDLHGVLDIYTSHLTPDNFAGLSGLALSFALPPILESWAVRMAAMSRPLR